MTEANVGVVESGDGHEPAGSDRSNPPGPAHATRRGGRGRLALVTVVVAALVGAGSAMTVARITGWGNTTTVTRVVNRYLPQNSVISGRPTNIQSILHKVLPGVVSITATSTISSPFFGMEGRSATVEATGTGIIISAKGEIVTNDHVVSGASSVTVTLNDTSTKLRATVIGESAANDLALLRVTSAKGLTPLPLGDSQAAVVGDGVLAVGYALGLGGGPTVTDGIISAKGREVTTETADGSTVSLTGMLQTDAAISSGNSGGPLVNSAGQVLGINTVVATSSASQTAQNIGFAIPAQTLKRLLPDLRQSAAGTS